MVTSNIEFPSIRGKRARVVRMDSCGRPVAGAKNQIVVKGMIKADMKAEMEDGEDTYLKDANGDPCFVDKAQDQLKYLTLELEFCKVNPELFALLTSNPVALNGRGESVGYSVGDRVEGYWALELWGDAPGIACAAGIRPYTYLAIPLITNGKLGDHNVSVSAATFTITANTQRGNQWGAGLFNVDLTTPPNPVPGKLVTPLAPSDHYRFQVVEVPPPALTDGAVAYVAA